MSYGQKFKDFISESKRVFRITKKPSKDEYLTISKVSGIGILIIGLIGFTLHVINELTSLLVVSIVVTILILVLLYLNRAK